VARAYRLLDEAGLISTQQGRGTYIWEPPGPQNTQKLRQEVLDELTRAYLREITNLGFTLAETLDSIKRGLVSPK
jgi:DNA-binding transcriptional regulator YhcF (GntR family)